MDTVPEQVVYTIVDPLVSSGVVREDEIGTAISAVKKAHAEQPLTAAEQGVAEKMTGRLPEKKDLLRYAPAALLSWKILALIFGK